MTRNAIIAIIVVLIIAAAFYMTRFAPDKYDKKADSDGVAAPGASSNVGTTGGASSPNVAANEVPAVSEAEAKMTACLKSIAAQLRPNESYTLVDSATCTFSRKPIATCNRTNKYYAALSAPRPTTTVQDRNYLLNATCLPGAFFYGKQGTAQTCAVNCQFDPDCAAWSWNASNTFLGADSVGECWGAPATTPLVDGEEWKGFVSGKIDTTAYTS